MKILHIEDRFHPNMGYQLNYFAEFHNPDISFHILTSKSLSLWEEIDINKYDKIFEDKFNIKITRLESSFSKKGKYWLWLKDLFKTIRTINPDIIYVHGLESLTAIRIIFSKLDKKYLIVSDTHTLLNQLNNNLRGKILLSFVKYIYSKKINTKNLLVFYTARENGLILEKLYGIKRENIKETLIGTNLNDYKYDNSYKDKIKEKLGIPENCRIILYTGKINNKKKPHLILTAVKKIEHKINFKLCILFIGAKDQKYFDDYFNITLNENIKLIFHNHIPNKELYMYYSLSDFAVFPKENTLSALDAQACKLPVIMEEDSTNEERLQEGGLLYKKDDSDNLSEKIFLLLNDSDLRKRLSEKGYEFIKNNYDYKRIVEKTENYLIEKYNQTGLKD